MVKLRDNLYLGGYKDIGDGREMRALGVTAVLNVAYELDDPPMYPTEVRYAKVGLADSSENKDYMKALAVSTLVQMLTEGEVVFVHCAAGLSRSVYAAAMALALIENKDWHDTFDEIKKENPFALIGPLFHGENVWYRDEEEEKAG